jgi:hypothetical protein
MQGHLELLELILGALVAYLVEQGEGQCEIIGHVVVEGEQQLGLVVVGIVEDLADVSDCVLVLLENVVVLGPLLEELGDVLVQLDGFGDRL